MKFPIIIILNTFDLYLGKSKKRKNSPFLSNFSQIKTKIENTSKKYLFSFGITLLAEMAAAWQSLDVSSVQIIVKIALLPKKRRHSYRLMQNRKIKAGIQEKNIRNRET